MLGVQQTTYSDTKEYPTNKIADPQPNPDVLFLTFQAKPEEYTLNKIEGKIPSPLNTYDALEYRKVELIGLQDRLIKIHNKNNNMLIGINLAIAAFIIASAVISPWFTIGLALSVVSAALLLARSRIVLMPHDKIGMRNMCIDMLLAGIKNNINPNNLITIQHSAELISILDHIIPIYIVDEEDFIASIREYNNTKNRINNPSQLNEKFELLKDKIIHFSNLVFDDCRLIDCLHSLDVDIEKTQLDIQNYNLNSFILDEASQAILGKRYTPSLIT